MKYAKKILKKYIPKKLFYIRDIIKWENRSYESPSPHFIKQSCLMRNGIPNAPWIETGTYLGSTTEYLSKFSPMVYSIEPEPLLFNNALKNLKNYSNIELIHGTSESIFPSLLPKITGDINFWLDGHYSAGTTFKGKQETPILDELKSISHNLSHFRNVAVLIDDVRCFNPDISEFSTYPTLDQLVFWANDNGFKWYIEHDIFVAKRFIN